MNDTTAIDMIANDIIVWLKLTQTSDVMHVRAPLQIGNGLRFSVQYSPLHNCSGRDDDIIGWINGTKKSGHMIPITIDSTCEVWYPSDSDPTDYVPIRSIAQWVFDYTPKLPSHGK